MFNKEFYPTPKALIEKMLEPYRSPGERFERHGSYDGLDNKIILEPSAGKGDIVDYITGAYVLSHEDKYGYGNYHTKTTRQLVNPEKVYCCEADPNLRHILQDKDYRVIANDFLSYNGDYYFDLILMNPPFSNGDEHLLKAWEVLQEGEVVCLLNAETLRNPYSERRKLLVKIIEQYGSWECLGNAFSTAERKTDVEVALVRLKKVAQRGRFDFEFENVTKERSFKIDESNLNDAPALKDVVGNMIIQYDKIKEAFVEYMRLAELMNHYGSPLTVEKVTENEKREIVRSKPDIFEIAQRAYKKGESKRDSFNIFCDIMKANLWEIVLANINTISSFDMQKFMTHAIRQNFAKFSTKQGHMDFTRENVWSMIELLFENRNTILENSIVEVFDIFTKYTKDNCYYPEGWKTNDKWKVNRKIILPRAVSYGSYRTTQQLKEWGDTFRLDHGSYSEYSDIEKALDYISGGKPKWGVTLYQSLDRHFNNLGTIRTGDKFDNTGSSFYFDWKFWKKGTLHITFKDEKLWQEFNIRACKGKNWLPEKEWEEYTKTKEPKQQPVPQRLQLVAPVMEDEEELLAL